MANEVTTIEDILLGDEEAPIEEAPQEEVVEEVVEEEVDFPDGLEVTLDTQKYLWPLGHIGVKLVVYSWDELTQLITDWIAFQDDLKATYAERLAEVYDRVRYDDEEEEEVGTGPTTEQWRTIFTLGNQKGIYVKKAYPNIGQATPREVERIIEELRAMPDKGAKDEDEEVGPSRLRRKIRRIRRR